MTSRLLIFLAVAMAYAAGAQTSFAWFGADDTGASFFPAAGVTLAALLLVERRSWFVVVAAAATAEFALNLVHDIEPVPAAGYTLANLIQPLVAAFLITRLHPRVDLSLRGHLAAFLAFGVVVGPLIGGVAGASTFVFLDGADGWTRFAFEWWIGDGLGALVVGSLMVAAARKRAPISRSWIVEASVLIAASAAATAAVFWFDVVPLVYVPVLFLLAAGFRLGTTGVAAIGAVIAFVAAQATASGHPFWDALDVAPSTGLLYLQLTLGTMVATALGISAEVSERERRAVVAAAAAQFEVVANSAPAMLWVVDSRLEPTFLSRGWFDYTAESGAGGLRAARQRAVHPDDLARTDAAFLDAAGRHESFSVDYRLRRADGHFRWVIDEGRPRFDDDGALLGYVGSVIDVHERQEAARALHESEFRLRTLFSSIDEGYCMCQMIVDDRGRAVDYRFVEVNPLFAAMTGLDDAAGRTAMELVPELEPWWVQTYASVAFDGVSARFSQHSAAMDRYFDVFATPVEPRGHFALVFTDVTQTILAARARSDEEAAQRRARDQAEFTALFLTEVESVQGVSARAARMVDLLVPRFGDFATFTTGGNAPQLIAFGHRDPDKRHLVEAAGALEVGQDGPEHAQIDNIGPAVDVVALGKGADPQIQPPAHSQMSIPVDIGSERAILRVWSSDHERPPYDEDDLQVVTGLAARASLLLSAARVQEHEHRTSLRLQRALLPDPVVNQPNATIAARYVPAEETLEVGGDWYDAFTLPSGRLGLVVGDVVGHGLEAAAEMGALRVALSALAHHAEEPGRLLSLLDDFARGPSGTSFATVCFASFDQQTGELSYALAGHPPPLVVSASGHASWLDDGRSVPLCSVSDPNRPEASVKLEPGSILIMYSDGLIERRRRSLDEGLARLEHIAVREKDAPVEHLCDCLVSEMTGESGQADDVVVLCMRYSPVAEGTFSHRFPAAPEQLAPVRAAVREWMQSQSIAEPQVSRVLLALGEACSNAVEHAYRGEAAGVVDVTITRDSAGGFAVEVRDHGSWWSHPEDASRGRGTPIMQQLARDFARRSDEQGTTVNITIGADQ